MSQSLWTAVDEYIDDTLVKPDPALDAALEASRAAKLPDISVSPSQGKLLNLMVRMAGARRILEIGTLGGYSAIWLARALPPGGKLITLEYDARHAEVARANIARAGLSAVADVITGRALDTLPSLAGPFDFFFIDADKRSNADYFRCAVNLSKKGSVIVIDNVVREGAIIDAQSSDSGVQGVHRLNEAIAGERRVEATAVQTVGVKGHDGLCVALVVSD